jgi:hypothetical protein
VINKSAKVNRLKNEGGREIRFGIISDGTVFAAWEKKCIFDLLQVDNVKLVLLILVDDHYISQRKNGILWHYFNRIIVQRRSKSLQPVDISDIFNDIQTYSCKVHINAEQIRNFKKDDVEAIKRHKLDFILNFGLHNINGDILQAAKFGIWSFFHAGDKNTHGEPLAYRDIYENNDATEALLFRITDNIDMVIVLRKGFFNTIKTSYIKNLDQLLFRSTLWPAQVCIDIQNGNTDYINGPVSELPISVLHAHNNLRVVILFFKILKNIVKKIFSKIFFYDMWNIAVIDEPIHTFLKNGNKPKARWLSAMSGNKYYADPFPISRENNTFIYFEEYDYQTSKGFISGKYLDSWSDSPCSKVIQASVHMSYPYILEYEGEIYCIPEASESKEVAIYKVIDFPFRMEKIGTLINNYTAIDSTVFLYNNRWWLMATDGALNEYDNLNIWFADDLLGPWIPHPLNPVKLDICSARPAGPPFIHKGQLYRPSQDCSGHYGKRIVINRIIRLTPTEFREEKVAVIDPYSDSPYPDGLHTISSAAGGKTIIDGKKRVLIGTNFTVLKYKVRKVLSQLNIYGSIIKP